MSPSSGVYGSSLYSAVLLTNLFAHLPLYGLRTFTFLAVLLSILSLSLLGGMLRHAAGIFPARLKPWGFDTALGLAAAAAWLVLRSFLANLAPGFSPPALEQEATIAVLLWMVVGQRRSLAGVLQEYWQRDAFIALLAFLVSLWALAYWHAFDLLPLSSDPGLLGVLVDTYRNTGHIAFSYAANDNIQNYPNGIMILSWAFANPCLTTISILQMWPNLTTTLLAFIVFEWLCEKLEIPRQRWLAALLSFLVLRLSIGSIDVIRACSHVEGVSKRSVGFLVALALAIAAPPVEPPQAKSFYQRSARVFLSLWPLALVTAVNPINGYISAAGGSLYLLWNCRRRAFYSVATLLGVAIFSILVAATLLQDSRLTQEGGPASLNCRVLGQAIPYCRWATSEHLPTDAYSIELVPASPPPAWQSSLPRFLRHPGELLYPGPGDAFHATAGRETWAGLLAFAALSALLGAGGWQKRQPIVANLRRLARSRPGQAARNTLLFLLLIMLFATLQTYVLTKYASDEVSWLIPSYTDDVIVNFWFVIFYVSAAASLLTLLSGFASWSSNPVRRLARLTDGQAFAGATLLLSLALAGGAAPNIKMLSKIRQESGAEYGRRTRSLASLYVALAKHLPATDSVMLPSLPFQQGPEYWNIPIGIQLGFHYYLPNPVLFSYPGQGPRTAVKTSEHFKRLCGPNKCQYLREQGVRWLIATADATPYCNVPGEEFAMTSGCFTREFTVSSYHHKITATGFRLK